MDDEAAGDAALDDRQADQAFAALLSKASRTGEAWELLDFANLRLSLDDQAQSMSSDIEERLQARQNLKALAKRFKKDCAGATAAAAAAAHPSATAALDAAFAPDEGGLPGRADALVKAFKEEVDAATKRAKVAEASFLSLYRQLRDEQLGEPGALLRSVGQLGGTVLQGKESLRHLRG